MKQLSFAADTTYEHIKAAIRRIESGDTEQALDILRVILPESAKLSMALTNLDDYSYFYDELLNTLIDSRINKSTEIEDIQTGE